MLGLNRKKWVRSMLVAPLVAIISAGITGCGSGSSNSSAPTPTPTPAPTPNPRPAITALSPNSAVTGGLAFTLTVHGSNFLPVSTVEWNGSSRTTTLVSNSQLQAHIMQADLASAASVPITVVNPAPGGGTSNLVNFTIPAATIAFQSSRATNGSDAANFNNTSNIWTMNPDGSGVTDQGGLTGVGAGSFLPVWSPDGTKLARISTRDLTGFNGGNANSIRNIWVQDLVNHIDFPAAGLLAVGVNSSHPQWSPDSSKLLFDSSRALDGSDAATITGTINIWVMNADGSAATPLTRLLAPGGNSSNPVWSPDGSKVAFSSGAALDGSPAANNNSTTNIWVMNADGSGAVPLTKLVNGFAAGGLSLVWSPDGSKIAFLSGRALDGSDAVNANGTINAWVINADGSAQSPVTKLTASGAGVFSSLAWSPDGSKFLFASARALNGSDAGQNALNVWVVNADGSGAIPVTKLTAVNCSLPVWSPDGSKVLFHSSRALDGSDAASANFTSNIWVVNSDGSGATPLTKLTAKGADSFAPNQP